MIGRDDKKSSKFGVNVPTNESVRIFIWLGVKRNGSGENVPAEAGVIVVGETSSSRGYGSIKDQSNPLKTFLFLPQESRATSPSLISLFLAFVKKNRKPKERE